MKYESVEINLKEGTAALNGTAFDTKMLAKLSKAYGVMTTASNLMKDYGVQKESEAFEIACRVRHLMSEYAMLESDAIDEVFDEMEKAEEME